MQESNTPTLYVESLLQPAPASRDETAICRTPTTIAGIADTYPEKQTIEDILLNGEEPTEEFLEEIIALNKAPELSDEEFERQALEAPGADGDPNTPE